MGDVGGSGVNHSKSVRNHFTVKWLGGRLWGMSGGPGYNLGAYTRF